jgi:hypothetical protein
MSAFVAAGSRMVSAAVNAWTNIEPVWWWRPGSGRRSAKPRYALRGHSWEWLFKTMDGGKRWIAASSGLTRADIVLADPGEEELEIPGPPEPTS